MKRKIALTLKRGISSVISNIILAAVVVAVGGAVWSFAQGASGTIASSYVDDVLELVSDVTERFTVEYVSNNTDCSILHIWVFNYGIVNVTTDVYVSTNDTTYSSDLNNPYVIESGEYVCANITVSAQNDDVLTIKVHSRRQNNAYASYLVP